MKLGFSLKIQTFVLAFLSVLLSLIIKLILDPFLDFPELPYLLCLSAIIFTASYGGTLSGWVATFLAVLTMGFLVNRQDQQYGSINTLRQITFSLEGLYLSLLIGQLKMSQQSAFRKNKMLLVDIKKRVRLEQTKDEFVNIASHEIKTPLTTIKAFCEILGSKIKKYEDPNILTYIQKINQNVNRLNKIIDDFLDFTKIQSGKFIYQKELFNLNQLVDESVYEMKNIIDHHQIVVIKCVDKIIVYGDKLRLGQVLSNLILNAHKYSSDGQKIKVITKKDADKVLVSVTDYGVGIPKTYKKKIFKRYFRIQDCNNSKKMEGVGLGLYIAKEIIENHKGNIWVESKENAGSTFYFSLPVANYLR